MPDELVLESYELVLVEFELVLVSYELEPGMVVSAPDESSQTVSFFARNVSRSPATGVPCIAAKTPPSDEPSTISASFEQGTLLGWLSCTSTQRARVASMSKFAPNSCS